MLIILLSSPRRSRSLQCLLHPLLSKRCSQNVRKSGCQLVCGIPGKPISYYVLRITNAAEFLRLWAGYVQPVPTYIFRIKLIIAGLLALRDLMPHFHLRHVMKIKQKRQTVSVHSPNDHSITSILLYRRAIVLLTAIGVIFRSELALLLGSHAFYLLIQRRISLDPLQDILPSGLLGLMIGILVSVPIDSYFWQHFPTWSELSGFMYNVAGGKAADWGISPFHFYFTSSLPRLMFNPMACFLCIPLALSIGPLRKPARDIVLPNIFFIFLYSFQPHKEWRFIVYVVPPLLATAAAGAAWIWTRRSKLLVYRFLSLCLVASTLASFGASFAMLAISRLNYPGAEALNRLHTIADGQKRTVNVHMDTFTCMTGVTHFLENPPPKGISDATIWRYDKTEDKDRLLDPTFWLQFDYVLAESPERVIGKWEIVDTVGGYAGLVLLRPGEPIESTEIEDQNSADAPLQRVLRIRSLDEARKELEPVWSKSRQFTKDIITDLKQTLLRSKATKTWAAVKRSIDELRTSDIQEQQLWAASWSYKTIRRYLTGGWWIKPRMEPKIRILRQQSRAA